MRKKWSIERRLRGQNQRAKQAGAKHDLTMEQWLETLQYFDFKCAYCGGEYEVIEHYLPVFKAGTTVSNCVPACLRCNIMKDRKTHDLSFYQNDRIIHFVESKGIKIRFHTHNYKAPDEDCVKLYCGGCGNKLTVPGLSIDEAEAYINQNFVNTGYAYTA
jgi:hypothetical protein